MMLDNKHNVKICYSASFLVLFLENRIEISGQFYGLLIPHNVVPLFTICDFVTIYSNEIHKAIRENIDGLIVFVLITVGSLTRLVNPAPD